VEGRILTAAHVVQSADRICVEFFDGQLIPHSLTVGYVSARYAPNSVVSLPVAAELLQTDAAINSGNSGSPMFNYLEELGIKRSAHRIS